MNRWALWRKEECYHDEEMSSSPRIAIVPMRLWTMAILHQRIGGMVSGDPASLDNATGPRLTTCRGDSNMIPDVCLILEGTFPYVVGGVSAWVNELIRGLPDVTFGVVHISPL